MSIDRNYELDSIANEFINKQKTTKQSGLNPANHNVATKRYAKLSLSLTNKEKEQIEAYRDANYPRYSISSMILAILDKERVFDEDSQNSISNSKS
ncbi:hypothetical protein [Sulfurimonas sp.]|uniref:hypothetical protein n=1 Tax=Sulfurimonas sp. TaxID=2022749 RepID=UPI003D142331